MNWRRWRRRRRNDSTVYCIVEMEWCWSIYDLSMWTHWWGEHKKLESNNFLCFALIVTNWAQVVKALECKPDWYWLVSLKLDIHGAIFLSWNLKFFMFKFYCVLANEILTSNTFHETKIAVSRIWKKISNNFSLSWNLFVDSSWFCLFTDKLWQLSIPLNLKQQYSCKLNSEYPGID